MRVLVTGATGLVGCHTAAVLLGAGHEVRCLVRNPDRLERALAPLRATSVERVLGNVTDRASVETALEGCDAVVHAAAVFTLDRRREAEVQHTNVQGTENVLGAAVRRGLDPILYVSSISALFPFQGPTLTEEEPVKQPRDMYARSKAAAERVARRFQEAGAPIVTVYPGGIWGPNDPTVGDGVTSVMGFIKRGLIPVTPGGMPLVDVRDVAQVHLAALRPGRGPRRYLVGGRLIPSAELARILEALTGRRVRTLPVPGALARGLGRAGDLLQRVFGVATGITYEAMCTLTGAVQPDNRRAEQELGVKLRPVEETLGDTLRWMFNEGLLTAEQAGKLALPAAGRAA